MAITEYGIEEFLDANVKELVAQKPWMRDRTFKLVESVDELSNYIDEAISDPLRPCALDLETTGLNSRMKFDRYTAAMGGKRVPIEKIVGLSLCFNTKYAVYVPMNHQIDPELNLPQEPVLSEIRRLTQICRTIYHNAKFDLSFLKNYGVLINDYLMFEDTQLMARLFDAGQKDTKLKPLSERLLNQPMLTFEDMVKKTKRFDLISAKYGYLYAASDAMCTFDLFNYFSNQNIVKEQKSIYNLEKRVVFVVMEMESNLMKIDVSYLQQVKVKTQARLKEIEKEIFTLVGKEFNLGSAKQLGTILFDELKYKHPERQPKTANGQYMTDSATLEKMIDTYPIVKKIVEFRGLEKSLGTYITNLLANHDDDNCIKLGFHQSGTDTGRFSSPGGQGLNEDGYCGVNIQSLPSNYSEDTPDIRKAFIARPGYKIVAIDYSGEELRITANLSKEPKWVDEFLHGKGDLHTVTAKTVFKKEQVTKAERQQGKVVNFLTIYGGGSRGLAQQAKISENEAKRILAAFFEGLPTLKKWIDTERMKARKFKLVKTVFGRTRPLDMFYDAGDKASEAHADRCAVNTLVQSAGADIMKTSMVRVYNWIHKNNLQDKVRMLITMHDEIVFEIREDRMSYIIPNIVKIMRLKDVLQGSLKWVIPLTMDVEYGDSWHVDHDYFKEHPEAEELSKQDDIDFVVSGHVPGTRYTIATGKQPVTAPDFVGTVVTAMETPPETIKTAPEPLEIVSGITPIYTQNEPAPKNVEAATEQPEHPKNPSGTFDLTLETIVSEDQIVSLEETKKGDEKTQVTVTEFDKPIDTIDEKYFVYRLKNTQESTGRLLNQVILFLTNENKKYAKNYKGSSQTLKLLDPKGNILTVSDLVVPMNSFLTLARYLGL